MEGERCDMIHYYKKEMNGIVGGGSWRLDNYDILLPLQIH